MHKVIGKYAKQPVIAIDTETTGLEWWGRTFRLGGVVLFAPKVGASYTAVGHETLWDVNESLEEVIDSVKELAADDTRVWLMHNRGYDENVLRRYGVEFKGKIVDTMGLMWVINPHERSFALKKLGAKYVDPSAEAEEHKLEAYIRSNKLKRYTQVPIDIMTPYAEQDGRLTYALWEYGMKHLPEDQVHIHDKEQAWIGLLSRMASRGLPVDVDLATEHIDNLLAEAHRTRVDIAKQANMPGFNPGSWQQVLNAAHRLGVTLPSSEADVMAASSLPKEFKLGVLRYRQLVHTVGSYLEPMVEIAHGAHDGRVHTTFRTTTTTGRLAAGNPINLQGLPRAGQDQAWQGDIHSSVRDVVRHPDGSGMQLGFADFAQIDVRIGAHYAQDSFLMDVLQDPDGDIHTQTMNALVAMGVTINRSNTKRLVFGSQYGIGADKFAADVSGLDDAGDYFGISRKQAGEWLYAHRKRFPALVHVLNTAEQVIQQRGYISLFDGRKLALPEGGDPHAAFAWLVQGSGAQVIKTAMLAIDQLLDPARARLILQVHDEVIFEADEDYMEEAGQIVADAMATVWRVCRVPLYVQTEVSAPSWATKRKIGHRSPADKEAWIRFATESSYVL